MINGQYTLEGSRAAEIACGSLGVREAIALLPDVFPEAFRSRPELLSVTVSENNRGWYLDRDCFGDVVDLVALGFDDPSRAAARRILDWVNSLPEEVQSMARPRRISTPARQIVKFPVKLLPPVLANFIADAAAVRDVPVEMLAPACLGVMSGATGKSLSAKSIGGLTVLPNLYFLIGTRSGLGKSVASAIAFSPVYAYERRVQAHHTSRLTETKAALAAVQKEIGTLGAAREVGDAESPQLQERLRTREKELLNGLNPPRIVVEDATGESLATLLAANNGFLLSLSPDARSVFKILIGRYRNGSGGGTDEDVYLKLFSNDELRQDRVSRAAVAVQAAAAVVWMTQNDNIAMMFAKDALTTSGLACRFLVTRVATHRRNPCYDEVELSPPVLTAYENRIWELMDTYHQRQGTPFVISAVPEARRIIIDYDQEIEDRKESGELDAVIGFASRWAEMSWKLALTLHAIEHGPNAHSSSISAVNAHAAVEIIKWFVREQQEIIAEAANATNDQRVEAARRLVQATPGGTTPRLLQKANGALFPSSEESREALETLVAEGGAFRHGMGKRPKYCPVRAPKS